jgi:hypothetical protein
MNSTKSRGSILTQSVKGKSQFATMNRGLLALLGFIYVSAPLVARSEQYGDWTYSSDGVTVTIIGYTGTGGAVAVPATIPTAGGPLPVTSLGEGALSGSYSLTGVTIPSSVTNVAFTDLITSGGSIVGSSGWGAFDDCSNLLAITVDPANSVYSSEDGVLFNKSQTTLIYYPQGRTGDYTLPNGAASVGKAAFLRRPYLTAVTIPDSVTNIEALAFYDCGLLASVTLGDSVTSVGDLAFCACTSLSGVAIGPSVTNIGNSAFAGCASLLAITVYELNPAYSSVDGVLFDKSQGTLLSFPGGKGGSYTITNRVAVIATNAFGGCLLTDVTIPNSVTRIEDFAFRYCNVLTNIAIPGSVTNIGNQAFSACRNLTAITVHPSNLFYSSDAQGVLFNQNQSRLIQYPGGRVGGCIIPNTVTSIGEWSFYQSYRLTGVTIADAVGSIEAAAFMNCFSLTNVTIPDSVTNIAMMAFYGCSRLSNIVIPNHLTSLQGGVFGGCLSLTSLTIPASVTNVEGAFSGCFSLVSVFFRGNAPSGETNAFAGDYNVILYYLPGTSGWGATFATRPTLLWNPVIVSNGSGYGVQSNRFGFNVSGTPDIPVVVEATSGLGSTGWLPLGSFSLTNGLVYFSDAQWANYPQRFYRLRSP